MSKYYLQHTGEQLDAAVTKVLNAEQLPSTTNLLKGDGSGGISGATPGTDYVASPEIFWATYGTTTYAQINTALIAGKDIKCSYNDMIYNLSYASPYEPPNDATFEFSCYQGVTLYYIACTDGGGWTTGSFQILPSTHTHSCLKLGSYYAYLPTLTEDTTLATNQYVDNSISTAITTVLGGSY